MPRIFLMFLALLVGCSPASVPQATPSPSSTAPAAWTVRYETSQGEADRVEIWADGSVYAVGTLRQLVGRVPPDPLRSLAVSMTAPEMVALNYSQSANVTHHLDWYDAAGSRNYSWGQGDLPAPLQQALTELETALKMQVAAQDDQQVTWEVKGNPVTLIPVESRVVYPAVGGMDVSWTMRAQQGPSKLTLAAVGQLSHVNQWPGKTLGVSGEWNGQRWRGELRIDKIVNGIVQGTITGEVGGQKVTGRLKTDVQILALP